MSDDINNLLKGAVEDGALSAQASQVLTQLPNIGGQIQAALCPTINDVKASQVTLCGMLVDDSTSIRTGSNSQIVRDGHNMVIDSLSDAKRRDDVLIHTSYLNNGVLFPFSLLDQAIRMDNKNYNPNGGTPLYDQTAIFLGSVITEVKRFEDLGVQARSVCLIITDGADYGSNFQTPDTVKMLVDDMLRTENHIVAGMGIEDGSTDFRDVFRSMGIPDEWILTPGNTQKDIRDAFQLFSQSAVRASQHAGGNFSNFGGFGG